jgi:3-dehydroquinate dehydratase type I
MKIFTPIQPSTTKEALKIVRKLAQIPAADRPDGVEIWLDHIQDLDTVTLFKGSPLPIIAVCKKPIEKGHFKGAYSALAQVLIDAAANGANFIDIPFKMPKALTKKMVQQCKPATQKAGKSSKIIISYHNFKSTPSLKVLLKKAHAMRSFGADIVKIAVMPKSLDDTMNIIALAQQLQAAKIPHICIAMGKLGALSRVLTPHLGGMLMFAPVTASKSTATGQLTVKNLRSAWGLIKKFDK